MAKRIDEIRQIAREALSELSFPISVDKIGNEQSLQQEYGFDSIMLMEYMLILEEKLKIHFDENFNFDTLDSILKISEYIAAEFENII